MAILGSHNSMTYLKSHSIFMNIFKFCWRCQTSDIDTQLLRGVRCFDIRIRLEESNWVFAHGKSILKATTQNGYNGLDGLLNNLNKYAVSTSSKIYIRLILEESKENLKQEEAFVKKVKEIYNKYTPNLIFFEFTRKFDWKILVDTGVYIKEPEQFVGSMKSWYGKIWPWLYWKINNNKDKEAFKKLGESDIALFDFV